jgi:hypothetical protein
MSKIYRLSKRFILCSQHVRSARKTEEGRAMLEAARASNVPPKRGRPRASPSPPPSIFPTHYSTVRVTLDGNVIHTGSDINVQISDESDADSDNSQAKRSASKSRKKRKLKRVERSGSSDEEAGDAEGEEDGGNEVGKRSKSKRPKKRAKTLNVGGENEEEEEAENEQAGDIGMNEESKQQDQEEETKMDDDEDGNDSDQPLAHIPSTKGKPPPTETSASESQHPTGELTATTNSEEKSHSDPAATSSQLSDAGASDATPTHKNEST